MKEYKRKTAIKAGWLLVIILTLLPLLAACSNEAQPPKPPLKLPFAVQKAGTKIETELLVAEYREYIFSLQFLFKGDDEDRKRVKKLVGEARHVKNGDPGVPTPLRFTINVIDTTGEHPIRDQVIPELRLISWSGNSFDKLIDYVVLKPGRYRIRVESLKDAPELDGTTITFSIGSYAKATPIKDSNPRS